MGRGVRRSTEPVIRGSIRRSHDRDQSQAKWASVAVGSRNVDHVGFAHLPRITHRQRTALIFAMLLQPDLFNDFYWEIRTV